MTFIEALIVASSVSAWALLLRFLEKEAKR